MGTISVVTSFKTQENYSPSLAFVFNKWFRFHQFKNLLFFSLTALHNPDLWNISETSCHTLSGDYLWLSFSYLTFDLQSNAFIWLMMFNKTRLKFSYFQLLRQCFFFTYVIISCNFACEYQMQIHSFTENKVL